MKYLILLLCHLLVVHSFMQGDEANYLGAWNAITSASFTTPLPNDLLATCKRAAPSTGYATLSTVQISGKIGATQAQKICGTNSQCVVPAGSTLIMDGNLNVAALQIFGTVIWNDSTQLVDDQYLCAGFIAVESTGKFMMSLQNYAKTAYIYLKDNGAVHTNLRTRVFGGYNPAGSTASGPVIDIEGSPMLRTWSLLSKSVSSGVNTITLMHDPIMMGWQIGDRIEIAPTQVLSQGTSEWYYITAMNSNMNSITLSKSTGQAYDANFYNVGDDDTALASAEVTNLSRNIIFTGDDFNHLSCDPNLPAGISLAGCACGGGKSKCTMGLHTMLMGSGTMKIQYSRIEKCGQRGVKGKYCLHFHFVNECPDCLFKGNAIENSQQRGIVVHETHLATVENNVMTNIRGVGLFIEDGNEMYNKIKYNVVICPFPFDGPLGGCTVPGTDNEQADTSLNQAGIWSLTPTNDIIGNRIANSFNGMFYDCGSTPGGQGGATGKVNTYFAPMGRLEGNTFHGHKRFGTYILDYYPKSTCYPDMNSNGYLTSSSTCNAFDNTGLDTGRGFTVANNVDYQCAYIGGYNIGDIQLSAHASISNLNNIYWKETKNFNDGCSAHITGSFYKDGRLALPDMSAFIIENTIMNGYMLLESAHHCNIGETGFLCMPTYVLSNVQWYGIYDQWVEFHAEANHNGGIFTLPPPEQSNTVTKGFFPNSYCSLAGNYWTYLTAIGKGICALSSTINNAFPGVTADQLGKRYNYGILCKQPLRALRVYTNAIIPPGGPLRLQIYDGATLLTTFQVPFHSVGSGTKQGYAFPVIVNTALEYRLSMNDGSGLNNQWIVVFSDPVIGNRWSADTVVLTVTGQNCNKRVITSQHDRRYLWSDSRDYLPPQAFGRGACSAYPDMPRTTCGATVYPIPQTSCEGTCPTTCGNGYCDCGLQQCVCDPGFGGSDCSIDLCKQARCGPHGRCTAKYLGSVQGASKNACMCDPGWSGPTCDVNVCASQTCSGNGQCVSVGDTDWRCKCNSNYSGRTCQNSCSSFGCTSASYPFGCSATSTQQSFCQKGGGCSYAPIGTTQSAANTCCYQNCHKCDAVTCPPASNDCHLAGSCRDDGTCSPETARPDGSYCNSVTCGVCRAGQCVSDPNALCYYTAPVRNPIVQQPTKPRQPGRKPTGGITSISGKSNNDFLNSPAGIATITMSLLISFVLLFVGYWVYCKYMLNEPAYLVTYVGCLNCYAWLLGLCFGKKSKIIPVTELSTLGRSSKFTERNSYYSHHEDEVNPARLSNISHGSQSSIHSVNGRQLSLHSLDGTTRQSSLHSKDGRQSSIHSADGRLSFIMKEARENNSFSYNDTSGNTGYPLSREEMNASNNQAIKNMTLPPPPSPPPPVVTSTHPLMGFIKLLDYFTSSNNKSNTQSSNTNNNHTNATNTSTIGSMKRESSILNPFNVLIPPSPRHTPLDQEQQQQQQSQSQMQQQAPLCPIDENGVPLPPEPTPVVHTMNLLPTLLNPSKWNNWRPNPSPFSSPYTTPRDDNSQPPPQKPPRPSLTHVLSNEGINSNYNYPSNNNLQMTSSPPKPMKPPRHQVPPLRIPSDSNMDMVRVPPPPSTPPPSGPPPLIQPYSPSSQHSNRYQSSAVYYGTQVPPPPSTPPPNHLPVSPFIQERIMSLRNPNSNSISHINSMDYISARTDSNSSFQSIYDNRSLSPMAMKPLRRGQNSYDPNSAVTIVHSPNGTPIKPPRRGPSHHTQLVNNYMDAANNRNNSNNNNNLSYGIYEDPLSPLDSARSTSSTSNLLSPR